MNSPALTATLEDYLEAIFEIVGTNQVARSMEIADKLEVKRSSVTVALRSLAEKGFINYQARSYVTLTDNGLRAARCVSRRHRVLQELFTSVLCLSGEDANQAACAMEHGMTSQVCRKISALLTTVRQNRAESEKLSQSIQAVSETIDCSKMCGYDPTIAEDESKISDLNDVNTLSPGESGIIRKISGTGGLTKRLRDMGITRGQRMTVVRAAPLDDPIQVRVRNCNISLRREEASMILLEKE